MLKVISVGVENSSVPSGESEELLEGWYDLWGRSLSLTLVTKLGIFFQSDWKLFSYSSWSKVWRLQFKKALMFFWKRVMVCQWNHCYKLLWDYFSKIQLCPHSFLTFVFSETVIKPESALSSYSSRMNLSGRLSQEKFKSSRVPSSWLRREPNSMSLKDWWCQSNI